ncbi:hypothetical protein PHISP_01534 [Aspergillus sp. HF37]|nr:hypothetical protein PHISP_01534 [Aspergillus sp. HF37]
MSPKTSPCPDTDNTLSSPVAPEAETPTPSGGCAARAPEHSAPYSTAGSNPSQGREAKRLTQFEDLPIEIHDQILDHLFGVRGLSSGVKMSGRRTAQGWSKAMRYQRREHIWCLALVSRTWRVLVQRRIYRHLKIKGTDDSLRDFSSWLGSRPRLAHYIRHIEVWMPVWSRESDVLTDGPYVSVAVFDSVATVQTSTTDQERASSFAFHVATLGSIFRTIQTSVPAAQILTLEGGHCKNSPMVRYFADSPGGETSGKALPVLSKIEVLVMGGAWNIVRSQHDFDLLTRALPGIQELHCAYTNPTLNTYSALTQMLPNLPRGLGIVDETEPPHLCPVLGGLMPQLESFTYTGKVCAGLFREAMRPTRPSKLKHLALTVKSCCRPAIPFNAFRLPSVMGVMTRTFIEAFTALVTEAVGALAIHKSLDHVRIHMVDIDSPFPMIEPYFDFMGGECIGLWSEEILEKLHSARPGATFASLERGIRTLHRPGRKVKIQCPTTRPLSIKAEVYEEIVDRPQV